MKNFFLTGYMGVGKTYLGNILLKYLNKYVFIDTDYIITYTYNYRIIDFYFRNKFLTFRRLEKNFINLLSYKKYCIISCGGGIILNKVNILRINIKNFCYCIMLNKLFLSKTINIDSRPILKKNLFKIRNKRKKIQILSSSTYIKNSFKKHEKVFFRFLNTL
ncbi:shikimate kinase [Candidatus Vidania fulgoroideorum]